MPCIHPYTRPTLVWSLLFKSSTCCSKHYSLACRFHEYGSRYQLRFADESLPPQSQVLVHFPSLIRCPISPDVLIYLALKGETYKQIRDWLTIQRCNVKIRVGTAWVMCVRVCMCVCWCLIKVQYEVCLSATKIVFLVMGSEVRRRLDWNMWRFRTCMNFMKIIGIPHHPLYNFTNL